MVSSAFAAFCSVCALSKMKGKNENIAHLGALWMGLSRLLPLTLCFALLFSSNLLLQATVCCGAGCMLWHSALVVGINRNPCIWTTCSHEISVFVLLLLIIQCEISVPCRACDIIIVSINYSGLAQAIYGYYVWQQSIVDIDFWCLK